MNPADADDEAPHLLEKQTKRVVKETIVRETSEEVHTSLKKSDSQANIGLASQRSK